MNRRQASDLRSACLLALALHGGVLGLLGARQGQAWLTAAPPPVSPPVPWPAMQVRLWASHAPAVRQPMRAALSGGPPAAAVRDPAPPKAASPAAWPPAEVSAAPSPVPSVTPSAAPTTGARPTATDGAAAEPAGAASSRAQAATGSAPGADAADTVMPPRHDAAYLHNPAPVYPMASQRMEEEGRVWLQVRVSADGQALQVVVQGSSGHPRLDDAARQAVARWRFTPARRGAEAVEASVVVPITFSLTDR